jgi:hypothetical protein
LEKIEDEAEVHMLTGPAKLETISLGAYFTSSWASQFRLSIGTSAVCSDSHNFCWRLHNTGEWNELKRRTRN